MIFCYINKLPPSSVPFIKTHFICSQFCRSGIWPELSWAVLLLYMLSAGIFHEVEIGRQLEGWGRSTSMASLTHVVPWQGWLRGLDLSASPFGFFTWQLDSRNEYSKWWSRSCDLLRSSLGRYTPPLVILFWWKLVLELTQIWREGEETPPLDETVERFFTNEHKGWEILLQPSFETVSSTT